MKKIIVMMLVIGTLLVGVENAYGWYNFDDFATLAYYWLSECDESNGDCEGLDLIPDGDINLLDFASLASGWYPIDNNEFTIIVLPDTQNYLYDSRLNWDGVDAPSILTQQTQWIADNKESLNIKFVIHEGDLVWHYNNIGQWDNVDESMSVLDDANVPYSVLPGNHEHDDYASGALGTLYTQHFPPTRFSEKGWFDGGFYDPNNSANYNLMTIENEDYIFISLDFCPSDAMINWANGLLTAYSDRKAILTTHAYLNDETNTIDEGLHNFKHPGSPDYSARYIWDDLIKNNENLQLVLCGHDHDGVNGENGEKHRTDNNDAGKPVHQILANYQYYPHGGDGWLRIMKFAPLEDKIYVDTYSPYLDAWNPYPSFESSFILDYDFAD